MRMIERWFPTAEVSEASAAGWGSGQSEKAMFPWFAARPLAQAKAAVLTSLLPWPDDPEEQRRLQDLVRAALTDRDAGYHELTEELARVYPEGSSMLDPFSGRAMIPLEAARLGVRAWGIDYSPVATLAGTLLADYPLRDWSDEPELPFAGYARNRLENRLVQDVRVFLDQVGSRFAAAMCDFYPQHRGRQPWGYLWATTLPCQECGRRFPIVGSLVLRHPLPRHNDQGQSFQIRVDRKSGQFEAVVHDGSPIATPTLVALKKAGKVQRGKVVVCAFCEHVHSKDVHTRLANEGLGRDVLLLAADLDDEVGKSFRPVTDKEVAVVALANKALLAERTSMPGLTTVPNEVIPPSDFDTVRASMYGARTYGDLCNDRQTLAFVRLCRIVNALSGELTGSGISADYGACLCGYAGAVIARKLKYSTRGVSLQPRLDPKSNRVMVGHVFANEASISFSYDYFETGLSDGPGSWPSLADDTLAVLRSQVSGLGGRPALIRRGSALALPLRAASLDAVVTDPPYDQMIDYSDISDLFYVWLKRALMTSHPDFGVTADPDGLQEKAEEIIVKRHGTSYGDHRTQQFYDTSIAQAFAEAERVVKPEGVVTIVFGHGEPEVWHRLLAAITAAGLNLTGSWPAKTEKGGKGGSANIVTTLTLACRPAVPDRPVGRLNEVDAEVRSEVKNRVPLWEKASLALTDQLMASAGPAMEVVGRYREVLDRLGHPVDPSRYLVLARRAVEEAAAIKIDGLPLETFDSRTHFALFWARLFRRGLAPSSEARWQAMVADLTLKDLDGILTKVRAEGVEGIRLSFASETAAEMSPTSSTFDVALALVRSWSEGLAAAGQVLAASGRDEDDSHLWAALTYLGSFLATGDRDGQVWTSIVRSRRGLGVAARDLTATSSRAEQKARATDAQGSLFDIDTVELKR